MSNTIIYWPPWSGKSTIWGLLADMQWKKHIDTDTVFLSQYGAISDFIMNHWEPIFRQKEWEILQDCLMGWWKHIISLGWGTLLLESNQKLANRYGNIVTLMLDTELLVKRIQWDRHNNRPLAQSTINIRSLLSARHIHYSSQRILYIVWVGESPEQIAHNMSLL